MDMNLSEKRRKFQIEIRQKKLYMFYKESRKKIIEKQLKSKINEEYLINLQQILSKLLIKENILTELLKEFSFMSDWTFFDPEEKLIDHSKKINFKEILFVMFRTPVSTKNLSIELSSSFIIKIIMYMEQLISFLKQFTDVDKIPSYELLLCKIDFVLVLLSHLDFQNKNDLKEFFILEILQYFSTGDDRNISRIYISGLFDQICEMMKVTHPNNIEEYSLYINIFENMMNPDSNLIQKLTRNGIFEHIMKNIDDISEFSVGKNLLAGFFHLLCKLAFSLFFK